MHIKHITLKKTKTEENAQERHLVSGSAHSFRSHGQMSRVWKFTVPFSVPLSCVYLCITFCVCDLCTYCPISLLFHFTEQKVIASARWHCIAKHKWSGNNKRWWESSTPAVWLGGAAAAPSNTGSSFKHSCQQQIPSWSVLEQDNGPVRTIGGCIVSEDLVLPEKKTPFLFTT